MAGARFQHPLLGTIQGIRVQERLIQFRSLPYGHLKQRFGRSTRLDNLLGEKPYDATKRGPQSIQPLNAAHMDTQSNQLPQDVDEQEQSEDCLRLTITIPQDTNSLSNLPVLVFLHGGAFFLGSGERAYYSPLTLCAQALEMQKPLIFVSLNYRLGALGFLHSSEASDAIPPNNGLHDQLTGFDWIHRHIEGFGGDRNNITAVGQSAGGESLSLHNLSGRTTPLYKRSIMFSGTPLTMPDKTPSEHQDNFIELAKKLGIDTMNSNSADIAQDMIACDISKIRDLSYVGQPCVDSEAIPQKDHANIRSINEGHVNQVQWLESQIISSASYDGSISNIMMRGDKSRKDHARSFIAIAQKVLRHPEQLLQIYGIEENMADDAALEAICQFESDIGFFVPALALANSTADRTTTYFQLFDLGNPFDGPLEQRKFASHTWDIVALLGSYEQRLSEDYILHIRTWRERYIRYIADGTAPWSSFDKEEKPMLTFSNNGSLLESSLGEALEGRRRALLQLAQEEGPDGADRLWEGVCRRWLMKGE